MSKLNSVLVMLGAVTSQVLLAQDMPPQNKAAFLEQMAKIDAGIAAGPYKADWADLERHQEAPEWFLDAKLGIYFVWGIYTVTGTHEWYLQKMYTVDNFREFHEENYGTVKDVPYHTLVDKLTGEHVDAAEWAKLFKETGAKFAGPVAIFHDTFAMWDSQITPWNSVNYGPKIDLVGEIGKAIKAEGLKFITTFHNERSQAWIPREPGSVTTSSDPEMKIRYANYSVEEYGKIFLSLLGEVVDKYEPDVIWFDGKLDDIRPDIVHRKFLSYYLNSAQKWGREVVVNTKKHSYPPSIAVLDYERGGSPLLTAEPWVCDDFIGSGWMYRQPFTMRPVVELLHSFVDIISKNGALLMVVAPTADGRITDDQRAWMKEWGSWMKVNSEAIYATRPWLAYGEGPNPLTMQTNVGGKGKSWVLLTDKDVRYTRSKDNKNLYAFVMGWGDSITFKAVKANNPAGKVELLGYGPVEHITQADGSIQVKFPNIPEDKRPCKYAYCFKLSGFEPSLQSSVAKSWKMVPTPIKSDRSVIGLEPEDK